MYLTSRLSSANVQIDTRRPWVSKTGRTMSLRVLAGVAGALILWAGQGLASPITIENASFEVPTCGAVGPSFCTITTGWVTDSTNGNVGSFLPPLAAWASLPDGLQVAYSNGGTLTQNLGVTIVPDMTYTLSVWVSQRFTAGTFQPDILLLGGGTTLLEMTNGNPGGLAPTQSAEGQPYDWVNWTMSWQSPSSGAVIGQTLSISLGSGGTQTNFDNISLDASAPTVPEPGMFLLVAGGLIGLGIRRRITK
jgi:hypothetical protein